MRITSKNSVITLQKNSIASKVYIYILVNNG